MRLRRELALSRGALLGALLLLALPNPAPAEVSFPHRVDCITCAGFTVPSQANACIDVGRFDAWIDFAADGNALWVGCPNGIVTGAAAVAALEGLRSASAALCSMRRDCSRRRVS